MPDTRSHAPILLALSVGHAGIAHKKPAFFGRQFGGGGSRCQGPACFSAGFAYCAPSPLGQMRYVCVCQMRYVCVCMCAPPMVRAHDLILSNAVGVGLGFRVQGVCFAYGAPCLLGQMRCVCVTHHRVQTWMCACVRVCVRWLTHGLTHTRTLTHRRRQNFHGQRR